MVQLWREDWQGKKDCSLGGLVVLLWPEALDYAKENLKEEDVMVIILPDLGTRYLGKVYSDDWMKERGFLENRQFSNAREIAERQGKLITVSKEDKVSDVISLS